MCIICEGQDISQLKILDCGGCTNLTSLPPLPQDLKELHCFNCTNLTSLPPLTSRA